jgi:hypothetical protein
MNPLASTKCARRAVMALAAVSGIFLLAGCGSSNPIVTSLGGGFSKSSLSGQYAMWQTGIGLDQAGNAEPFSEVSIFMADGNGNLSILVDDFDQDGVQTPLPTSPEVGSYSISSDGTGSLNFGGSAGSNYAITMIDDSHFYLIEKDTFASSAGYGQLQTTTAFTASPSGTFVFKAHNAGTSSRVGGFTITGGAISGTEDFLSLGVLATSQSIATSVALSPPNSTTGRGTFTLTDGTSFGYYVVNANEFYFMSNSSSLELGEAQTQTAPGGGFSVGTLANNSSYVFGSRGDTINNQAGIHSAGVFTTDGNGNITAGGAVDYVQDATVNTDLAVSGGSYTLASNGRGTVNLLLSGGSISPQVFWMINGTSAYFLADNTTAVEDGRFTVQTASPALSGQAAFVMDGFDTSVKDRVGDFKTTSSTAFNWNQTANASGNITGLGTNGTFTASSNGRVAAVVNGVTTSVVFYLSSNNSGFMVQEDANIGGAFVQQASQ